MSFVATFDNSNVDMSLKDNSLFHSTGFILKFCKYIGYLSYEYEQISEQKIGLKLSLVHFIFWAILQALCNSLNIMYSIKIATASNNLSQMENIFLSLYYIIETCLLFINQSFSKIFNRKMLNIFNKLNEIEESLWKCSKMRFSRAQINIVVLILIVLFIIFIIFNVFIALTLSITAIAFRIWTFVIIFGIYSSQIALALLFCTALAVSRGILNEINTYLRKSIIQRSPRYLAAYHNDLKKVLRCISSNYHDIFHCIRELRSIFGLPILFQTALTFLVTVNHAYKITSIVYRKTDEDAVFLSITLALLVLNCILVGIYVIVCELYTRKVSIFVDIDI